MIDGPPTSPPAHPDATGIAEQRVSSLVGDRMCIRCAYNLVGQPVLREPHYNMLIVRCPECATVASVQEYPLLGRWANRWAAVAVGLWFLLMMGLWIGTGAMIFGFSVGIGEWAAEGMSDALYNGHQQWSVQAAAATQPGSRIQASTLTFENWWNSSDSRAFIAEQGGWLALINWEALLLWIPLGILSFALGCVWAMMLLGQRIAGRLLWGGFIVAVATAFSIIPLVDWIARDASSGRAIAYMTLSPIFLGMSVAFGTLCLGIGLVVGRNLIRWLLCLLLPPRLRSPLAMFWLADGLEPPSTAGYVP